MATGTVSSISQDNYQLIATNTTTSGTTSTFTFSGYKKLMLAWNGVSSSGGILYMTFNSSSSGYSGGAWGNEQNGIFSVVTGQISLSARSGDTQSGCVVIENTSATAPKTVNGTSDGNGYIYTVGGTWNNTEAVTSLIVNGGGTFTAGSISLYGIAA